MLTEPTPIPGVAQESANTQPWADFANGFLVAASIGEDPLEVSAGSSVLDNAEQEK